MKIAALEVGITFLCVVATHLGISYWHHCWQGSTPGSSLPVIYDSQVQGFCDKIEKNLKAFRDWSISTLQLEVKLCTASSAFQIKEHFTTA